MNEISRPEIKNKTGIRFTETAPMGEHKISNTFDVVKNPIIPNIAIIGELGRTQLTDGTIVEAYLETGGSIVVTIADNITSANLSARNDKVELTKIGDYLEIYSILVNKLKDKDEKNVKFLTSFIRRYISHKHGTTPNLLIVDKTGRYGHLSMVLPGEAPTRGIGIDLSEKSYMEFYMGLEGVFTILKEKYPHVYSQVISFMQLGNLGGGTLPWLHAHLIEILNKLGIKEKFEKKSDNPKNVTQENFERVGHKKLDYNSIKGIYEEIIFDNFLILFDNFKVPKDLDKDEYKEFYTQLKDLKDKILLHNISLDDFLIKLNEEISIGNSKNVKIIDLVKNNSNYLNKKDKSKIEPIKRAELLISLIENAEIKIKRHKNIDKAKLSKVQHVFASGVLRNIKPELEKEINKLLEEIDFGDSENFISVEIDDSFDFYGKAPMIKINSTFKLQGLYGQKIEALVDKTLNEYWGKIYDIAEELNNNDREEIGSRVRLKKLLGLEDTLLEMYDTGLVFEENPSSLFAGNKKKNSENKIISTTNNYINYFLNCFKHSGRSAVMHNSDVMPRVSNIIPDKEGNGFSLNISPSFSYLPIMSLKHFEKIFGPYKLFKEINSRLELVDGLVVQKTGGEGFHTFIDGEESYNLILQRKKKGSSYNPLPMSEEDWVRAVRETMLENIANPKFVEEKDERYLEYYLKKHFKNYVSSVNWKLVKQFFLDGNMMISEFHDEIKFSIARQNFMEKCEERGLTGGDANLIVEEIFSGLMIAEKERIANSTLPDLNFLDPKIMLDTVIESKEEVNKILSNNIPNIDEADTVNILEIYINREHCRNIDSNEKEKILIRDNILTLCFHSLANLIVNKYYGDVIDERTKKYNGSSDTVFAKSFFVAQISSYIYRFITKSENIKENIDEFIKYLKTGNKGYTSKLLAYIKEEVREKGKQTKVHQDRIKIDYERELSEAKQKGDTSKIIDFVPEGNIDVLDENRIEQSDLLKINYFNRSFNSKINSSINYIRKIIGSILKN